eukprot:CAMPEP_0174926500 /NCGR_PEP_ID=MMETSP1355-20121228/11651_1 /TAXON_ID=464990 /ORGANISM="Hemiselmis tepida, Strain CCMP443" /LENGTH=346 /DNA_ID=CAMNT_0016172535 /DNA_START=56 /DNA_END=1092 /DNA_ORIENTATION=-
MTYGVHPESYGAPAGSYGRPNTYGAQPGQFADGHHAEAVEQAVPVAVPAHPQAQPVVQAQPVYGQHPQNPAYQNSQAVGQPFAVPLGVSDANNRQGIVCCFGLAICFGLCVLVGGVALLVVGGSTSSEAAVMEPERDFAALPWDCVVTHQTHCWSTTEDRSSNNKNHHHTGVDYECTDTFEYDFTSGGEGGLKSELFEVKRGDMNCGSGCDSPTGRVSGGPFAVGDATTCWEPSAGRGTLPSTLYQCPNAWCVKLEDPKIDLERAENLATGLTAAGVSLLVLSLGGIASCSVCCFLALASARRRVVAFDPGFQPYVPGQPQPPRFDPYTGAPVAHPVPDAQVYNGG